MLKKLMLASVLVATSAIAQQNTDISGANFQSGKADAALAALGRQAAASGDKLVITAPAEWHAKIAAKVHAGGNANLVLREGFYENVLVRVEDKSAKAASVEAEKTKADVEKIRAEAQKAKAEADKSRADAERAKAEAEVAKSLAEAEKAKAQAEAAKAQAQAQQAAVARAAVAPAVKPAPAPVATTAAPAAAANDVAAIRARLEQSLNDGRNANGPLPVAALQAGDTLYVDGAVRAVSRREGNRLALYWLDGNLDLRRSELKVIAPNRYQLLSSIRGEGSLRREATLSTAALEANEPAADAPGRLSLEKSINDGHTITQTLAPAKLRSGDIIYTNGSAAAVVRREGRDLTRFWLIGSLDLTQAGVQADGANKYKVTNDALR
jgi:chemotaxis protein histidine kinase CheA